MEFSYVEYFSLVANDFDENLEPSKSIIFDVRKIKIVTIDTIYSAITIEILLSFQTNEHENGTSQATLCSTFALQYLLRKGKGS